MRNINFQEKIELFSAATAAGAVEGEGKLEGRFDHVSQDDLFGAKTWEIAESEMVRLALKLAMEKGKTESGQLQFVLGGDLLNQCTATSYGALSHQIPFLGLYGACSTFAEGLLVASFLLSHTDVQQGAVVASSHFSSAERQYRFPLEYGCQRPPTAQRTVTGAGAALLRRTEKSFPHSMLITGARPGIITDGGVTDANNMGAAMAPAAARTLTSYLKESGETPDAYDLILTGDLGYFGAEHLRELCAKEGVLLGAEYRDCGLEIFTADQDVHAGASGCGCSALYVCAFLKNIWKESNIRRVLFLGTGALLSPLTVQQKQSIPGIAHLVRIERGL